MWQELIGLSFCKHHSGGTMNNTISPEKRQFDFWLGDWNLTWGDGQTGTNRIEALWNGEVIQENFDGQPSMELKGMSVSTYDPALGKWRQTWVDSDGSYIDLTGEFNNNQMILYTTRKIEDAMVQFKMIFYNIAHDSFDWSWERSTDGQNWTPSWQIHYERANR
jgi:hypothetical protein